MNLKYSIKEQIILFLVSIVLTNCNFSESRNEEKNLSSKSEKVKLYSNKLKSLKAENPSCQTDVCTHVNISYPEFDTSLDSHQEINKRLSKAIHQSLSDYSFEENASSLDDFYSSFFKTYNDFVSEFPDAKSKWYVKVKADISFQSADFVSIKILTEGYTGGAHSNESLKYLNFNTAGEEITNLNFFFKDTNKLKGLAKETFKEQKGIDNQQNLADSGYLFEGDTFQLSETYGFNREGLVLFYNNYEIASYAEGPTELLIPYNDLGSLYRYN